MAKLIYALNVSLDGYVDHDRMGPPQTDVFHHFVEHMQGFTGLLNGGRMYSLMRYWDEDLRDWEAEERAFAVAWRSRPKWVVSRSLQSVGPNATLLTGDIIPAIRRLKAEQTGSIEVGGPHLAQMLTDARLIDEYQLYVRPVVLGHGAPFFTGPCPPLRLLGSDRIGEDVIRLRYAPGSAS